jgi:hypothetical protein
VLTINSILKGGLFPLGKMIDKLLTRFKEGFGTPVDMEYAVELDSHGGYTHSTFYLLQARPLVARSFQQEVAVPEGVADRTLIRTTHTMGNGTLEDLHYLMVVDSNDLTPHNSSRLAEATARMDRGMRRMGEHYVLVGPGRWGSTNPRLGIPVTFAQISNAAVIAETSAPGLDFEPSQGTHFFHLITAGGIFYMAVMPEHGDTLNRTLFDTLEVVGRDNDVMLLKSPRPLEVIVDGRTGNGIITITPEPQPEGFVPDWEAGDFD